MKILCLFLLLPALAQAGPVVMPKISQTFGVPGSTDQPYLQLETIQNLAPFRIQMGGRYFGSVFDDVLQIGFNVDHGGLCLFPGVAKWNIQLESDFWNLGRHYVEFNLDLITTNDIYRRFMYFGVDRDDPSRKAEIKLGIAGTGSFMVKTSEDNSLMGGRELFEVDTSGDASVAGSLQVNGGDTYGEALTVRVPESGMAMDLRDMNGDDLLRVRASALSGEVELTSACDSNNGSISICSQKSWKPVEQINISNQGVRINGPLLFGTNAMTFVDGNLFWNGKQINLP